MGFCLFNNVAVGARHALRKDPAAKILIVDWDMHHGNGTQNAFYSDRSVLFFSTHQFPAYPGTGLIEEVGSGEGEGYNINIPLPPGVGDEGYRRVFEEILVPVALEFRPDLIMVSAGQDAHHCDYLGSMCLSVQGYRRLSKMVREIAVQCDSRGVVLTLEGGYHLQALAYSVMAILDELAQLDLPQEDPLGSSDEPSLHRLPEILGRSKKVLGQYWKCLR